MTYEWLNSNFDVRACWDFRTGSAYELKSGIAPTVVGSPAMVPGEGLRTPRTGLNLLRYGDVLNITDTTQPFTWVFFEKSLSHSGQARALRTKWSGNGTQPRYESYVTPDSGQIDFMISNGTTTLDVYNSTPIPWRRTTPTVWIISYNGGLRASGVFIYANGIEQAKTTGTDTLVAGSCANTTALDIGGFMNTNNAGMFYFHAELNQAVTPAQAAAIYEQLSSEQPIANRPYRNYSLPPKSMTQAEYAAKGIKLDMNLGMCVDGKYIDQSGNGHIGTPVGAVDNNVDNSHVKNVCLKNAADRIEVPDVALPSALPISYSCWVKLSSITGNSYFMSKGAQDWVMFRNDGNLLAGVHSVANAVLISGILKVGRWYHLASTYDGVTPKLYINGILQSATIMATPAMAGNALPLVLGNDATTLPQSKHSMASARVYNRIATAEELRAEYLEGNKILFDGRLPKDGSCPVTPTTITGAGSQIPGTPWKLGGAGNWKVIEDAPVNGKLGQRRLRCDSGSFIYAEDSSPPYGSWDITFKTTANVARWYNFIADRAQVSNASLGYALYLNSADGSVALFRITGGGQASMFISTAGIIAANTVYRAWITRSFDGKFTMWIKGGAYSQWTLVPVASGTNPVIETTYTTSKYFTCSYMYELGDVIHYSC